MARLEVGTENSAAIRLHYSDHGSGRPVVLIHGWPLSGRSWESQVLALIDAGYRVITYDRRGFGQSSQPLNGYDYDTFAADLNTLIEHLDLTDAALVGFSMGGGEVVRYLSRHGASRVSHAVLAGAVPPFLLKTDDNPDGALDQAFIEGFQAAVRADRMVFLEEFTTNFFSANGVLEVSEPQRRYAVQLGAAASARATIDCIAAWGTTDFRADLATITVPTLILHGDADAIVPLPVSGALSHQLIAGSELVVVEGGPHGFNLSHSSQFNTALLDFLAR